MFQSTYTPGSIASLLGSNKQTTAEEPAENQALEELFQERPLPPPPKEVQKQKRKAEDPAETDLHSPRKHKSDQDVSGSASKKKKKTESDDEDGRDEKKRKFKKDPEKDKRTVFVGNLPATMDKKALVRMFKPFGKVESVRFRSAAPANLKLPKRAVTIRKEFHPDRHNINGYVVFADEDSCPQALELNGSEVQGNHIRVDRLTQKTYDHKRSVFIGNLSFKIEEEPVHKFFADCGDIQNVRLIRDRATGAGKGFGYVLFKRTDSVDLALKLQGHLLQDRKIRIERSSGSTVVANNIAKRQGVKEQVMLKKKKKWKDKKKDLSGGKNQKKKKMDKEQRTNMQTSSGPDFQGAKSNVKGQRLKKMKQKKKQKNRMERKKKKTMAGVLMGVKQPGKQKDSNKIHKDQKQKNHQGTSQKKKSDNKRIKVVKE